MLLSVRFRNCGTDAWCIIARVVSLRFRVALHATVGFCAVPTGLQGVIAMRWPLMIAQLSRGEGVEGMVADTRLYLCRGLLRCQ
jgi:hypothetical protein